MIELHFSNEVSSNELFSDLPAPLTINFKFMILFISIFYIKMLFDNFILSKSFYLNKNN